MEELYELCKNDPKDVFDNRGTENASGDTCVESKSSKKNTVISLACDHFGIKMTKLLLDHRILEDWISNRRHAYYSPLRVSSFVSNEHRTHHFEDDFLTVGTIVSRTRSQLHSVTRTAYCHFSVASGTHKYTSFSVYLTGKAFSKYCLPCVIGKVIALTGPKLSVRLSTSGTEICIAVSDVGSLQIIGMNTHRVPTNSTTGTCGSNYSKDGRTKRSTKKTNQSASSMVVRSRYNSSSSTSTSRKFARQTQFARQTPKKSSTNRFLMSTSNRRLKRHTL